MRITAGKYRNREIKSPHDARTHPMGERERLALFNMLGQNLVGLSVLDAYAGSGALGIEALSRGASYVEFIEEIPLVAKIIRENLAKLEVPAEQSQVICVDVNKMSLDRKFDIILADPPYDDFKTSGVEKLTDYLKSGGILVLSHPDEAPELAGLTHEKTRSYARARISFYTK